MRSDWMCWLSILILCGCGGGGGGGTGGGDGGTGDGGAQVELTIAEYGDQLAAATCAQAVGCCAPIELHHQFSLADAPVTDQASCEAYLGNFLDLEAFVRPSIERGRSTWDGARAAECVAALEALSCEEYSARLRLMGDAPLGCNPITGLGAEGAACGAPWECASGYCRGVSSGVEGTCAALPGVGAECPTGQCAEGLRCDLGSSTCVEPKADGAECTSDDECASNGCSAEQGTPGVCNAPSVCDGDLTDDEHEVYGTCSMQDPRGPDLAIACRLGTSGVWECDCNADGVETSCSPGAWDEVGDGSVCESWGCCGFTS
ncbi:hypothetical protein [Sandaracinus amylolyticus]|uniref:hypothetical protein n=1 Tax=Sandaracinus amylolyticus TaxID=927083 RepID=UPI001F31FC01|nr:hypothetical protein [Sandaracinus amylolyticus]UJR78168.1 Hypothetical protein I5071_1950 [Sandaracinus amylolyticus]